MKRRCHRCHGTGRVPCTICGGKGEVPRGMDHRGNPHFDRCTGCFGIKVSRCPSCRGDGFA
ncbi:hypothetical protein R5H32_06550 [Defluviimonas sp. D31]|uniref:hypothetical protein n=1 Tax=Defluviimonas sp. D31 TaxID=3083253 RepID=UPI00296FE4B7|nr:hypothetical protein [Defluviimonas sp. D31]MDW4549005.1 hypothetical protein [Defluviimonas sp. D31]